MLQFLAEGKLFIILVFINLRILISLINTVLIQPIYYNYLIKDTIILQK